MSMRKIVALSLGISAVAACNPVDASRTFDSSRGSKRFVLVTRFPMDIRPRAFEQDGPMEAWQELQIPDASGVPVELHGRQLLMPVAEENLVLEYYDRELAIPKERTATEVLRSFGVARRQVPACPTPLCFPSAPCTPSSGSIVSTSSASGVGIAAFLLSACD